MQRLYVSISGHMSMNLALIPARLSAAKETCLVVWKVTAITYPLTQHVVLARNAKEVNILRVSGNGLSYFILQSRFEDFIRIYLEYPITPSLKRRPVFLFILFDLLMLYNFGSE